MNSPRLLAVTWPLSILALAGPLPAAESTTAAGLVAAWSFDEARGRLIPDQSGRENHLSVTMGNLAKGVCGVGLELDSRHGYVSAVSNESPASQKELAVATRRIGVECHAPLR